MYVNDFGLYFFPNGENLSILVTLKFDNIVRIFHPRLFLANRFRLRPAFLSPSEFFPRKIVRYLLIIKIMAALFQEKPPGHFSTDHGTCRSSKRS
jgi:hypothetical protein